MFFIICEKTKNAFIKQQSVHELKCFSKMHMVAPVTNQSLKVRQLCALISYWPIDFRKFGQLSKNITGYNSKVHNSKMLKLFRWNLDWLM